MALEAVQTPARGFGQEALAAFLRGGKDVRLVSTLAALLIFAVYKTRTGGGGSRRAKEGVAGKDGKKGKKKGGGRSAVGMIWDMLKPDFARLETTGGGWQVYGIFLLCLLRIWIMNATSRVVQKLDFNAMTRDQGEFWKGWREQLYLAGIACVHRQTYKYVENSLAVEWRKKLTKKIHAEYFKGMHYYVLAQQAAQGADDGSVVVADADERITEDAKEVSTQLAHVFCEGIYASTAGTFFAFKLYQFYGIQFAVAPYLYLWSMFFMKGVVAPHKVGRWISETRALLTSYKTGHQLLVKNSEAVAALDGGSYELSMLTTRFKKAIKKARAFHSASLWPNLVEQMCFQWLLRCFMAAFVVGPHLFLTGAKPKLDSIKAIAKLRGDIGHQFVLFVQSMIAAGTTAKMLAQIPRVSGSAARVKQLMKQLSEIPTEEEHRAKQRIKTADRIEFDKVDIRTPTGTMLVRQLSFVLEKGHSLLLTGHNGAGKSSIFRCLGGLWDVEGGNITKPGSELSEGLHDDKGGVYYLPQKPYNVTGTLSEQLAYPAKDGDARLDRVRIQAILDEVDLGYLLEQYGTEEMVSWGDVLSLGEMQRVAMARLIFHEPAFAILDECTSAVSGDMERRLYGVILKSRNTAYITISHRPVLKMYHDQLLTIGLPDATYTLDNIVHAEHQAEVSRHTNVEKAAAKPADPADTAKPAAAKEKEQTVTFGAFLSLVSKGLPHKKIARLVAVVLVVIAQVGIKIKTTEIMGGLMSTVFAQDRKQFVSLIKKSLFCALMAGVFEQGLAYIQHDTAETMMENITQNMLAKYVKNNNFYKLLHLKKDGSIKDPHTRLTTDLRALTNATAAMIPQFIKPLVELVWFSQKVASLTGKGAVGFFATYLAVGFGLIRLAMPQFRKITATESKLEGTFKTQHSHVKDHCESIAFYGGGARENEIVDDKLGRLMQHTDRKLWQTWKFNLINGAIVREAPFLVQWILRNEYGKKMSDGDVLKDGGVKLGNAQAFIFDAVTQMFDCMGQLLTFSEHLENLYGLVGRVNELDAALTKVEVDEQKEAAASPKCLLPPQAGTSPQISITNVDIVTPTGQALVKNLAVRIEAGAPLMVTGRNASGKTSFFRVLGGLWPAKTSGEDEAGGVHYPETQEGRRAIYLVPQKVFMPVGTLADQITYPERVDTSSEEMKLKLAALLSLVGVGYLAGRHGWDTEKSWELIFSLGEQQRVGMARMFYHKVCVAGFRVYKRISPPTSQPVFGVLDECTSAVSIDAEHALYEEARRSGITCITISQRLALTEFHTRELNLSDEHEGGWQLTEN